MMHNQDELHDWMRLKKDSDEFTRSNNTIEELQKGDSNGRCIHLECYLLSKFRGLN